MEAMDARDRNALRDAIAAIDGVVESESAFKDDLAYWVNGTEIAHFESDTALDVRLTRPVIREHRIELRAESRVRLRASSSDWITVDFGGGLDLAVRLVTWAVRAHRAPVGTVAKPPPGGAELGRRKRLH
jgi:Luciferase